MNIEIRPAISKDASLIAKTMSEAAAYKASHGDYLWGEKPFSIDEAKRKIASGNLYVALHDGEPVGTVAIDESDERCWGSDGLDESSLYLHSLAVSDNGRGKGVGSSVITWAIEKVKSSGRESLRLDCSYMNQGLCDYYLGQGFIEVGRKEVPRKATARDLRDPVYKVALFEKQV